MGSLRCSWRALRQVMIAVGLLCIVAVMAPAMAADWLFGFAEEEAPMSDSSDQGAQGILPDLTVELFSRLPGESLSEVAGPGCVCNARWKTVSWTVL